MKLAMAKVVLFQGGNDDVKEFFAAFDALIEYLEVSGLKEWAVKNNLWIKLVGGHQPKTFRYEVKLPYLITIDSKTFAATLVVTTENGILVFEDGKFRVFCIVDKEISIEMALENMEPVNKVLNVQRRWTDIFNF